MPPYAAFPLHVAQQMAALETAANQIGLSEQDCRREIVRLRAQLEESQKGHAYVLRENVTLRQSLRQIATLLHTDVCAELTAEQIERLAREASRIAQDALRPA